MFRLDNYCAGIIFNNVLDDLNYKLADRILKTCSQFPNKTNSTCAFK